MGNDLWSSLDVGDRIALLRTDGSQDRDMMGEIVERCGDDPEFTVKRDKGGYFKLSFPQKFEKLPPRPQTEN